MCLLMGVIFWVVPVPLNKHLQNYRISLKILSVDYIVMSLLNLYLILFVWDQPFIGYFNFVRVLICSSQAFLFAFAMFNLLDPQYVIPRRLWRNLLPLAAFTLAYITSLLIFGNSEIQDLSKLDEGIWHPTIIIRIFFFLFYAVQVGYYSYLLYRTDRKFKHEMENYFSDTHQFNPKSFQGLSVGLVLFGVIALIFLFLPFSSYDFGLTLLTIVFYFFFAVKFINYPKLFLVIEPAIYPDPENDSTEFVKAEDIDVLNLQRPRNNWIGLKNIILEEKYYLKEQITLEEMAQTLRISRNTLSNLINSEEKQNFYSWINSLRIEQAKILFLERPDYTIGQIAQLTGFSETTNFSRTFKKITGHTPSDWRTINS